MRRATNAWSPVSPTTSGTPLGNRPFEAGRQIVEHDHPFAGLEEGVHHMAADIAGAAGTRMVISCSLTGRFVGLTGLIRRT